MVWTRLITYPNFSNGVLGTGKIFLYKHIRSALLFIHSKVGAKSLQKYSSYTGREAFITTAHQAFSFLFFTDLSSFSLPNVYISTPPKDLFSCSVFFTAIEKMPPLQAECLQNWCCFQWLNTCRAYALHSHGFYSKFWWFFYSTVSTVNSANYIKVKSIGTVETA